MTYLNIHEIKAKFSFYAKQVMRGKSFIISIRNRPFAELRPLTTKTNTKIHFGVLSGAFKVPEDFNAPLSDFEKQYYGE